MFFIVFCFVHYFFAYNVPIPHRSTSRISGALRKQRFLRSPCSALIRVLHEMRVKYSSCEAFRIHNSMNKVASALAFTRSCAMRMRKRDYSVYAKFQLWASEFFHLWIWTRQKKSRREKWFRKLAAFLFLIEISRLSRVSKNKNRLKNHFNAEYRVWRTLCHSELFKRFNFHRIQHCYDKLYEKLRFGGGK